MKEKKIVYVHLLNDYSGSPKVLSQIIKNFRNSYKIELFSSKTEGFLSNLITNHKYFFYKRFENRILTLFSYVLSQIQLFFKILFSKSDIIYINTILPFGAAISGKLLKKQIIYHIHETSIRPYILKKFLRLIVSITASKIIFVSEDLAKRENFKKQKTYIVHNSLENDFLQRALHNEYKYLYKDKFVVMMICSLKEYKGIPEFLKIASKLELDKRILFKLILGCDENEVKFYFENKKVPSNVEIYPKQKDLSIFYIQASLVLNLSRVDQCIETFGLTVLEALAYGIPVIAPPVGGPAEILEDGKEGYLISSYDVEKIVNKILKLTRDENLCMMLSKNAKEKAKSFAENIFIKKIESIINE